MEEALYLFAIIIIGGLIVIPIILLVNLSSANSKILHLQREIKDLNEKLLFLINNTANKQDIQQILEKISDKRETKVKTNQEHLKEEALEKKTEETKKEQALETKGAEQVTPSPSLEHASIGTKSQPPKEATLPHPDPQKQPAYTAINKPTTQTKISANYETRLPEKSVTASNKNSHGLESGKKIIRKIFGENWLPKIGIVTLVLGVGFFVKYAIDQNWINEVGRVGIGILTGAIIIGIAHKLKEKYHVFSSLLVGGGISIFYITITLAFREYEIFNQTTAFILLSVITIFSIILSLLYNRQELAVFSLIGGFCSPLMVSTGSGNYIVLFSFILILNTGMLIISLARNWRLIGIVSYVLSLIFFWVWLTTSFYDQFTGATIFASLFFVQFYLLAIIKHFREDKKLSIFQAIILLTNNLSILFALMFVFNNYEYDIKGLVVMAIAAFNAAVMITLFRDSKVDKSLIYLVIGVVMSFVTLAIPIQLHGYVITMFWAVEIVLLLWLWQKSKINVFRLGFLALSLLTIISYLMDINNYYIRFYDDSLSLFINSSFITGVVVILGFAVSLFLLKKEDTGSVITLRGKALFSISNIKTVFKFVLILLIFFVPYLEFNYQLGVYTDTEMTESFRHVTLATYTTCFIAALAILYRGKINSLKYFFFLVCVIIYSIAYAWLVAELRLDIFYYGEYSTSYFLIHFLSLPAVGYLIYLLIINLKSIIKTKIKVMYWVLLILSCIILSVELDHIAILILHNSGSYFSILYDVHTFGYPILWGLIAMILMIWGVKQKDVILRQISLISFGLIILKFYAYDVWLMSQTGRILSFVLLGVIILVVSFIQQKLKTLVKEDDQQNITENENKEI